MSNLLLGKPVSEKIIADCTSKVKDAINQGLPTPKLVVITIGEDDSNNSYIKGIQKKAADTSISVIIESYNKDISQSELLSKIENFNNDDTVFGILLMRPFPKDCNVDERTICEAIASQKDIDCAGQANLSSAYIGDVGFAPCTAEACMQILDYYNVQIEGKNAVVLGRSLVVGKPVANLLQNRNATVTICHSKTKDIKSYTKNADIIIVATGTANKFGSEYFSENQVVIDAGINYDQKNNKLCGDVDFEQAQSVVSAITPVPGGVGTVTSSILISHLVSNLPI